LYLTLPVSLNLQPRGQGFLPVEGGSVLNGAGRPHPPGPCIAPGPCFYASGRACLCSAPIPGTIETGYARWENGPVR